MTTLRNVNLFIGEIEPSTPAPERRMPTQNSSTSEQVVSTPPALIAAVEARFGTIRYDLACTIDNAICGRDYADMYAIETGSSLEKYWPRPFAGLCWLNPPYNQIAPWARKCHESGSRVAMLVPASVGTNWFARHVFGKAHVLALSPRVKFVGHSSPYPKDLILCVYGYGLSGFDVWRWA
jgi:DNA N-6-adenine-methyltransferase (Dam)